MFTVIALREGQVRIKVPVKLENPGIIVRFK